MGAREGISWNLGVMMMNGEEGEGMGKGCERDWKEGWGGEGEVKGR